MSISAVANSQLFIGTTKACASAADYSSDAWTQIMGIEDLGEFQNTANEIKFQPIDSAYETKVKGTRDSGDFTFSVGRNPSDPGQLAAHAAAAANDAYNFKLALSANGGGGTIYFTGPLFQDGVKFGTANNIVMATFKVGISGPTTVV